MSATEVDTTGSVDTQSDDNVKDTGLWVSWQLMNKSNEALTIKGLELKWGKLYKDGDKDKNLEIKDVEGTVIQGGGQYTVYSCGVSGWFSGTEGSFSLVLGDETLVCKVYWECPTAGHNVGTVTNLNPHWIAGATSSISPSGAIGNVVVNISRIN